MYHNVYPFPLSNENVGLSPLLINWFLSTLHVHIYSAYLHFTVFQHRCQGHALEKGQSLQ
jgi:hypothetical protein